MAAQCDETAHLTARERKARASAKLVQPDRLTEAATRYMDCEALAYWARQALERGSEPPPEVVRELERRCPAFSTDNWYFTKRLCSIKDGRSCSLSELAGGQIQPM